MLPRRRLLTFALGALGALPVLAPRGASASAPRSPPLRNPRLRSPLPSGVLAGYAGDTGLDLGGTVLPIYTLTTNTLNYSKHKHTQ